MKILAVSDEEADQIYELAPRGHFGDVQIVLGCGDLHYDYLEYLVTFLNVDLFYVPGNHDPQHDSDAAGAQAAGCTNLDLRTTLSGGLLIAGFGGSIRYRPDGSNQYTQAQAFMRAARLLPRLWSNRVRYGRALDVLVTHSPPFGVHDDASRSHRGLKAINLLMSWARPRYLIHGHMHNYKLERTQDVTWQGATSVLNVYPYRVIEIQDAR